MARTPVDLVLASLAVALSVNPVAGQCEPEWLPGAQPPGINGYVTAMIKWDPDGTGPAPVLLVAGGSFEIAGNAVAANVAAWDGTSWSALGAGLPDRS
jgi:hypothetical protein